MAGEGVGEAGTGTRNEGRGARGEGRGARPPEWWSRWLTGLGAISAGYAKGNCGCEMGEGRL